MIDKIYNVPDVSCEHCVNSITKELIAIDGIDDVQVDLAQKTVTVTLEANVSDDQVIAGLDEAGFDIVA